MKTINSLRSKLLALTLALVASVSTFAYDEMPDFQVDGLYYNFLEDENVEVTHPYIPVVPVENVASNTKKKSHAISADDYYNLTNLVIPSTVTYEGKVYNVTRIGYAAFDQCNLTYVDIPSSIKTIGVGAFSNCSSLTSITLKEGLEHIEGNAFADCRLLETITFPNSLKTVGSYAFSFTAWYNNQPNGGVYAGNVFYKYKGDIPENTSFVIKEGTVSVSPDAFIKENRRIDYGLVAVAIPNSVEIIGEYAFSQCRALRSVNIPSRVTTIESYAFSYCKSLTSVTSEIVEPLSLPSDVFFNASVANATLYVPAESVEAYKNADQWKDFGQVLPIAENPENLFPTLWGLQRTGCTKTIGENENGTVWGSRSYLMQGIGNTIIDGKQYVLFGTNNIYDEYCSLWLREENNKILVYSTAQKKDLVLYDFTLNVGDSLPRLYVDEELSSIVDYFKYEADWEYTKPLFVTEVSTITLLDGKEYKKWTFDNGIEYVEGIGSFGSNYGHNDFYQLIVNAPRLSDVYSQHLVCASKNGQLLYQMDASEMEQLETECLCEAENPEDLFPTLWGLQRTVCNEYCGETEDDNSANKTYQQTFERIFFENDKPYILCSGYLLREEDNMILIYSQTLNKDLVLYDFTLEVGDSLLALYINAPQWDPPQSEDIIIVTPPYNGYVVDHDYNGKPDLVVVTDISSVTLLDGKEYKKWTFNNGMEYVEGIGMYGSRRGGNFFGLIQEVVVPCHTGTHLVCVSKNNKLLYQMDDAEMERLGAECLCDYDRGPLKDNAKNGKIGGRPTPTQWNQLELDLREMENGNTILRAETFSYTLENDSIVANGKTYYQLARQSTKDTATTKSFVGALHFGEDEDSRVYFLRDGVEYVLYDFTAEPGDTIEIFAGINNYPQDSTYTHVVTGKDTLENGACRMLLEVVFPDETATAENAEKVWLAGLGSVDGIVHNAATRATTARSSDTQTSVMLCAWRDDNCLYTTDHPDYNTLGCVYNIDEMTSVEDTHSPLPMIDCYKLLRNGQLLIIHKGKTYNVLGVPVE